MPSFEVWHREKTDEAQWEMAFATRIYQDAVDYIDALIAAGQDAYMTEDVTIKVNGASTKEDVLIY